MCPDKQWKCTGLRISAGISLSTSPPLPQSLSAKNALCGKHGLASADPTHLDMFRVIRCGRPLCSQAGWKLDQSHACTHLQRD